LVWVVVDSFQLLSCVLLEFCDLLHHIMSYVTRGFAATICSDLCYTSFLFIDCFCF